MRFFDIDDEEVWCVKVTPNAEQHMAHCARVSNPTNQNNKEYAKLLRYCIKHKHWSVFEQAHLTVGITTSRAISAQILRHRSFTFQEFSQRYAASTAIFVSEARRQHEKNRQLSTDDLDKQTKQWWKQAQRELFLRISSTYEEALTRGVAKECARMLLPLATSTTLYMTGNVRSWIHYLEVRCAEGVQQEHKRIAEAIRKIFCAHFPTTAKALEWKLFPEETT